MAPSTPDDNLLQQRLERGLPRLLAGGNFDHRRDIDEFLAEDALLDEEIDRVWDQVTAQQAQPQPRRPIWWGMAAAGVVAVLGMGGFLGLMRGQSPTPGTDLLRLQNLRRPATPAQALAQRLEERWSTVAHRAPRAAVIQTRPQNAGGAAVVLLQSSGEPSVDRMAVAVAGELAAGAKDQWTLTFETDGRVQVSEAVVSRP